MRFRSVQERGSAGPHDCMCQSVRLRTSWQHSVSVLLIVTLVAGVHCQRRPAEAGARELLHRILKEQMAAKHLSLDPDRVVIAVDSSDVLPDVVYYWGFATTPRITDVSWHAVVAAQGRNVRLLRNTDAWLELAAKSGWAPDDRTQVLGAFQDALSIVGPRADPSAPVLIYVDSASIAGAPVAPWQIQRLDLPPPVVSRKTNGHWIADFWAVEMGQVTRYRCDLQPWQNLTMTAVDSVMYVGYISRRP